MRRSFRCRAKVTPNERRVKLTGHECRVNSPLRRTIGHQEIEALPALGPLHPCANLGLVGLGAGHVVTPWHLEPTPHRTKNEHKIGSPPAPEGRVGLAAFDSAACFHLRLDVPAAQPRRAAARQSDPWLGHPCSTRSQSPTERHRAQPTPVSVREAAYAIHAVTDP